MTHTELVLEQELETQITELLNSSDFDAAREVVETLDISTLENMKILQLCGAVYRNTSEHNKALAFSSKVLKQDPKNVHLAIVYSQDLMMLGQLDQAEAAMDTLAPAQQGNANALFHRSKIQYQKRDYKTATRNLVNVVKQNPKFAAAHMELAHSLLMHGKWPAGWQEYEWRFRLPKSMNMFPKFKMPLWDGTKVPHIFLIADQGYGDCFQFSRYIPLVVQRCEKVTLIRSEPLARLMDEIPSITTIRQWKDTPHCSAYSTLSSLPRLCSTLPNNIPSNTGILKADKKDVEKWTKKLAKSSPNAVLRIGVAWSGRVEFENNHLRAMAFDQFEPLMKIPELQFYSLQVGSPSSQAKGKNIIDLADELTDFAETAAAMEALDLIITTDTSIVHLAGALDRPTWALLGYAPDWRWGPEGSTSPWYTKMQLFRQDKPHNWEGLIRECKTLLEHIIDTEDPRETLSTMVEQNEENAVNPYL